MPMKTIKEKQDASDFIPEPSYAIVKESEFDSITKKFLASSQSRVIICPSCGKRLNFHSGLEWTGPDSFTCTSCNRLLSISLIQQALRDLGVY